MTCAYIQDMKKSNIFCIIEGPTVSCAKWAYSIYPPYLKSTNPLLKNFPVRVIAIPNVSPY